jgi:ribosome-binding ATPase YchF (GTP1/OBG family)
VVSSEDLLALGSMAEVKKAGRFRLEGKEAVVRDGEVVHIRSAV